MIFLFGYVKPRRPELLVRELEEYNGIYCSLCKSLGKEYGFSARLALNYDCTFYALVLLSALPKPPPEFRKGRCVVNPLKKCVFCKADGRELTQASALTMILVYYKLIDDIQDSGMMKKLPLLLLLPMAKHAWRKAVGRSPRIGKIVAQEMEKQRKVEQGGFPELDLCAEPSAEMMERIMEVSSGEAPSSSKARIYNRFGYYLGRWIYFMDAADDLADDLKAGAFNPFTVKFHLTRESPPEDLQKAKAYANEILNQTLSQLGAAFNLMETNAMGPIVKNVVFLGLPQVQKELLFTKEKTNV